MGGMDSNIRGGVNDNPALFFYGGNLDLVRLLLDAGADPDARSNGRRTLLMEATRGMDIELMQILLDAGADPNITVDEFIGMGDDFGLTVLMVAVRTLSPEIVRLLIDAGADPNLWSGSRGGRPPLLEAVRSGNIEVVRVLLEAGADVNVQVSGGTVLEAAERLNYTAIARLLRDAGATG